MRALLLLTIASTVAYAQGDLEPYQPQQGQPAPPVTTQPTQPAPATTQPTEPPTTQPTQPPTTQPTQPPTTQPTQPAAATVMSRRWAVSLGLGLEGLASGGPDHSRVQFGFLDVAGYYRIVRAFELGLALHLGSSEYAGVKFSEGGFYINMRYRFLVERPWNVYLSAGLGGRSVSNAEGTDTEKKGRGSLRVGAGVERRWTWFALFADLHLEAVAQNPDVPLVFPSTVSYEIARYGLTGGALALGVTFYF